MRKALFVAIAALLLITTPALADLTTKIKVTNGPGSGNGGTFWVEITQGVISYGDVYLPTGSKFLTFCIENDEYLGFGSEYWVEINTNAVAGGSGGPSPDPLDPKTAALYRKWIASGDTTHATATKYQLAMWKVEQEAVFDSGPDNQWEDGNGSPLHNDYNTYTEAQIDALINSVGSPSGIQRVRVMNLWQNADKTGFKQDLLVIPAPAAIVLGLMGLGLAGWVRKRIR